MVREPYRIAFFMPPPELLGILSRVVAEEGVAVVFQRFKSNEFGPGVHVIPPSADLEKTYREGCFGPIYLSIGGLPGDETDLRFAERSTHDLINIEPGRIAPGQIALSEIYRLGESSKVQTLFERLEREIAARSHKGVRMESYVYPDIYWSEDVRSLALYRALGKEASRFQIVED
jgi:hypothetical protein